MYKKCSILSILLVIFLNFIVQPVYAEDSIFAAYTYSIDSTGKYIIDIPGYTTIQEFKSNVLNLSVEIEGITDDTDQTSELIKTGTVVKLGGVSYTAIVLGDLDGDGKCTYKDILMERDYLEDEENTRYEEDAYSSSYYGNYSDFLTSLKAWTSEGGKVFQKYGTPNRKPYVGRKFMKEYNSLSTSWRGYTKKMWENYCCVGAEITLYHVLLDAGYSETQIKSIMPMEGQTSDAIDWAKNHGVWHKRSSSYNPKAGDIITFGTGTHTELVIGVSGSTVTTINLNSGKTIKTGKTYQKTNSRIYGYIEIKY